MRTYLMYIYNTYRNVSYRNEELLRAHADPNAAVPKPPHWGGYLIRPLAIEFWQGRPSRLHDRIRCSRASVDAPWTLERLQA